MDTKSLGKSLEKPRNGYKVNKWELESKKGPMMGGKELEQ